MHLITSNNIDQLAKPTFRSRYAHTPLVTEQSEGPMDTVASSNNISKLHRSVVIPFSYFSGGVEIQHINAENVRQSVFSHSSTLIYRVLNYKDS